MGSAAPKPLTMRQPNGINSTMLRRFVIASKDNIIYFMPYFSVF